jgi:hypothetical protein
VQFLKLIIGNRTERIHFTLSVTNISYQYSFVHVPHSCLAITKSTEEEVQTSLITTGTSIPFSKLKYDQDKLSTHCENLDIPFVVLPKKYQEYQSEKYGCADYYRLRITYLDYHYS